MTTNRSIFTRISLAAVFCTLAAGCVAVVPTPGNDQAGNGANRNTLASMCNIEGKQEQDLSDGTTKASVIQSCEETAIYIENKHQKHPKRCRVITGAQATELYIMPGESRTLTQTGPLEHNKVQLACINDWSRTK